MFAAFIPRVRSQTSVMRTPTEVYQLRKLSSSKYELGILLSCKDKKLENVCNTVFALCDACDQKV